MTFTDNPFEKEMQRVPPAPRPVMKKAPPGSPCFGCAYWQGMACVGTCYKKLEKSLSSGQAGPKPVFPNG